MARFWFSGPRIFGIRPGISVSPQDFQSKSKMYQKSAGERIEGSFLYVIRGDHNMVKIGVTTNPAARLASLRTGSAFPIEYSFIGATTGSGLDIEKGAHALLAQHACNGEWFDVSPELAASAILGAAAKLGHPMKAIDEKTATQVLQIAANSGSTPPRLPPMNILHILGAFGLSAIYLVLMFAGAVIGIALAGGKPLSDMAVGIMTLAMIIISLILGFRRMQYFRRRK